MRPDPVVLESIRAGPGASEPRLALAEWFEKHGAAARAELIRADVALRTRVNPARRRMLGKRVRELVKEHAKAWAAELPGVKAAALDFGRGIIEQLQLTEESLAEHGEELLSREPVSRLCLEVRDGKGLEKVARQSWFERIRWLKVLAKGDKAARALAAAPHAGRLHTLILRGMGGEGLATLFGSERLSGLRVLGLTGDGSGESLDNEALEAFVEGRLQLERLFMSACLELKEPLSPLVDAEWLRPLKVLALNRNNLTDDDAQLLAESEVLENLERLELAGNEFTDEGVLVFRSAKALPRLEYLDLSGSWYERETLASLRKRFGAGLKV